MGARGESYSAIADHLTSNLIPIAGNSRSVWQPYRIKRLLANRVYLGEARSGDGIANMEAHEPLVDAATWTLAQRQPTTERRRSSRRVHLLAGICRCASCTHAMRSQAPRGTTVGTYRCSTTSVHGRCPAPSTISLKRLDEYVVEQFLAHAGELRLRQVATADHAIDQLAGAAAEAEASYREALTNIELRQQIGAADHDRMVAALHEAWRRALAAIPEAPVARPEPRADVDVGGSSSLSCGDVATWRRCASCSPRRSRPCLSGLPRRGRGTCRSRTGFGSSGATRSRLSFRAAASGSSRGPTPGSSPNTLRAPVQGWPPPRP